MARISPKRLQVWIALLTAIIACITSLILLFYVLKLERTVNTVERNLDGALNCWDLAKINLKQPENRDQVSDKVVVWGEVTPHPSCRYIYIFVRDLSVDGPSWRLTGWD